MQAQRICEVDVARIPQHAAAAEEHDRAACRVEGERAQQRRAARLVAVQPLVRDAVPRGELAQPMRVAVEARADDADSEQQPFERPASPKEHLQHEVAEDELASDERPSQQDAVRDKRWRRRMRWRAFRTFLYGLILGIAAVIGTLALMIAKWG